MTSSQRTEPVSVAEQTASTTVDVVALMDRAAFRGVPLLVSVLTTVAMILDGFDIQLIAFAAPHLIEEFGISRMHLGPILASGLVGMAIGGFVLGTAGDRFGRRVALSTSLLLVAVTSLGAAFCASPNQLMWWRLATGVGLGGVVPNCTAMMMEFAPLAVRNMVVALTVVGVPIGGVLGAEVAARILPTVGWRAMFIIGATLPGVLAAVILLMLPESPRYLARTGRQGAQLAGLLSRVTGGSDLHADMKFDVREPERVSAQAGLVALLGRDFRRDALLIWLIFATNIFAVYAFFNWLPTVLRSEGLPLTTALRGSLIFNLGGVVAAFFLAGCMTRFGSRSTLRIVGCCSVAVTIAMGFVSVEAANPVGEAHGVAMLLTMMSLAGACILGMQVCMFAVAANAYPTEIRSAGVGWASGIARVGAIGLVLVFTVLGVVLLRRHIVATSGRRRMSDAIA